MNDMANPTAREGALEVRKAWQPWLEHVVEQHKPPSFPLLYLFLVPHYLQ